MKDLIQSNDVNKRYIFILDSVDGLITKGDKEKTLSEADYQRLRVDPEEVRYASLTPQAFGIRNLSAEGGIMNDMQSGVLSIMLTPANREKFQVGGMKRDMSNNRISQIIQLIRDAESVGDKEKAEELRLDLFRETKKADGGRIGYFMGSEIPVRQNQGGVTELDLRNKGGFIPVGIKEKADDVPAMLSKNEFVFTADAVRGAWSKILLVLKSAGFPLSSIHPFGPFVYFLPAKVIGCDIGVGACA